MELVRTIDSHTFGEPTRTVISGIPDLGNGLLADRAQRFASAHAGLRRGIVCEPRGGDVWVGALLVPPDDPSHTAAVVFFTTVGVLGMCGHGAIGVIETLRHLGRIGPGTHTIQTPVGLVQANLLSDGRVEIRNVESFRFRSGVALEIAGTATVGDVAYGGNWFFLVRAPQLEISESNRPTLNRFCIAVRDELARSGVTGSAGEPIDHVECFGPSSIADSKNYVLCPGGDHDRSPCGTGTSAKLACLAADGELKEGQVWRQEGFAGGVFEAWFESRGDAVAPTIRGRAFVTAESHLVFDPADPMAWGIP